MIDTWMAGPNEIPGNGGKGVIQRSSRALLPKKVGRVIRQFKEAAVHPMEKEDGRVISNTIYVCTVGLSRNLNMFLSSEGTS